MLASMRVRPSMNPATVAAWNVPPERAAMRVRSAGFVFSEGLFFDEGRAVTDDPNLNADVALYRLGRQP